MATDADPIVGHWFQHLDKGQKFEVVAVDQDAGTVEIQYFDGGLDVIELSEWHGLELDLVEPPEDPTGPENGVEYDDLGYTETDMEAEDWSSPLRENKRPGEGWEGEESDDWAEGKPEEQPWEGPE